MVPHHHRDNQHPTTHAPIAHAVAYLIDRLEIEPNAEMDDILELSETTEELLHDEVFYDDVCMEKFVVWHELIVEPEYRRQGLGRREIHNSITV